MRQLSVQANPLKTKLRQPTLTKQMQIDEFLVYTKKQPFANFGPESTTACTSFVRSVARKHLNDQWTKLCTYHQIFKSGRHAISTGTGQRFMPPKQNAHPKPITGTVKLRAIIRFCNRTKWLLSLILFNRKFYPGFRLTMNPSITYDGPSDINHFSRCAFPEKHCRYCWLPIGNFPRPVDFIPNSFSWPVSGNNAAVEWLWISINERSVCWTIFNY